MDVVTITDRQLRLDCEAMADFIMDNGISEIIGIQTGGKVISDIVYEILESRGYHVQHYDISASRTTTGMKSTGLVRRLIGLLPRFIKDGLRKAESLLVWLQLSSGVVPERRVKVSAELSEALASGRCMKAALIDDAIDSGHTLRSTIDAISSISPRLPLYICVLSVTQSRPVVQPHYSMYQHTLLRMPWSMDAK